MASATHCTQAFDVVSQYGAEVPQVVSDVQGTQVCVEVLQAGTCGSEQFASPMQTTHAPVVPSQYGVGVAQLPSLVQPEPAVPPVPEPAVPPVPEPAVPFFRFLAGLSLCLIVFHR